MDKLTTKIKKYSGVIAQYINTYAEIRASALGNDIEYQSIIDVKNHHYQVVKLGWVKQHFAHSVLIHIDINKNTGKVWLQQNNTETLVAQELVALGIPQNEIILGFQAPELRKYTQYAEG